MVLRGKTVESASGSPSEGTTCLLCIPYAETPSISEVDSTGVGSKASTSSRVSSGGSAGGTGAGTAGSTGTDEA